MRDARLALQAGKITAMHDPTEGGLAGALWELAEACGYTLVIDPQSVLVPPISRKICQAFEINPLETIASGALLATIEKERAAGLLRALAEVGMAAAVIGRVVPEGKGLSVVAEGKRGSLPRFARDEVARLFEASAGRG